MSAQLQGPPQCQAGGCPKDAIAATDYIYCDDHRHLAT